MLVKILPVERNYAWGSVHAIERILNRPNLRGLPVAELWYGAHSSGPSELEGSDENLRELLRSHAAELMGKKLFHQYGGELPFLFKLLSADKGLSIQAHPSKKQAEEGFAREDRAGIPVDAKNRNYRDDNHKPECLVALEDFWALSGFRPAEQIAGDIRELSEGISHWDSGEAEGLAAKLLSALENPDATEERRLEDFYSLLIGASSGTVRSLLTSALDLLGRPDPRLEDDPRRYWVVELSRQFPDDPGALAPLYLNVLHLHPDQALFMTAGILHAYLRGTGYEIMANSDNVLRGGCTSKHVDPDELMKILHFTSKAPTMVSRDSMGWYESLADEFQIAVRDLDSGANLDLQRDMNLAGRPGIVLVRQGRLRVARDGRELILEQGEAAFISVAGNAGGGVLSAAGGPVSFALASVASDSSSGTGSDTAEN